MTVLERFWRAVDTETACACHDWDNRCWIWTGCRNKRSHYGVLSIGRTTVTVHVFAYTSEHGALEKGLCVLHTPPCRLRHCVRHLYAGSHQQKTNDAMALGRFAVNTKILPSEYRTIQHAYHAGKTMLALARHYRVDRTTIADIVHGRRWRDMTVP
jgi:hypothetical protein